MPTSYRQRRRGISPTPRRMINWSIRATWILALLALSRIAHGDDPTTALRTWAGAAGGKVATLNPRPEGGFTVSIDGPFTVQPPADILARVTDAPAAQTPPGRPSRSRENPEPQDRVEAMAIYAGQEVQRQLGIGGGDFQIGRRGSITSDDGTRVTTTIQMGRFLNGVAVEGNYVVVSTDSQQRIVNLLAFLSDLKGTATVRPKLTSEDAEAVVTRFAQITPPPSGRTRASSTTQLLAVPGRAAPVWDVYLGSTVYRIDSENGDILRVSSLTEQLR